MLTQTRPKGGRRSTLFPAAEGESEGEGGDKPKPKPKKKHGGLVPSLAGLIAMPAVKCRSFDMHQFGVAGRPSRQPSP